MAWAEDFLSEITNNTGLDGDLLLEVVRRRADPAYAREAAARERQERAAREQAERVAASEKARTLLLVNLTPEQRAEFEQQQQFHVTSSKGNRFRIRLGRQHNVWSVDENGADVRNYCTSIHDHRIPDEDNVLAQKILLEADEDLFMSRANSSSVR